MYNMLDERITNTLTSRTFYKFVGFSVNLQTLSRVLRKSCAFWSVVPKSRVFWSGFMENSFWLLNNLQHCTQLTLLQRGFIPAVVSRNGCNGLGSELMFATFLLGYVENWTLCKGIMRNVLDKTGSCMSGPYVCVEFRLRSVNRTY